MVVLLTLTVGCGVAATEGNHSPSCLFWDKQGECTCKNVWNIAIICYEDQPYLRVDYGMDVWENTAVVVHTRYAYHNYTAIPMHLRVYTPIDIHTKLRDLNKVMCKSNNREGFLCGQCKPNYGPSGYSPKCHRCKHPFAAAVGFCLIKLLPVCIYFFLITTFRINITKGPMLGYIFFCQSYVIAAKDYAAIFETIVVYLKGNIIIMNVLLFFPAIWNMDFLQVTSLIHPFCISSKLQDTDVFLINYFLNLFPLFLVVAAYAFIELHARNFRLVVYCWKPFHPCFVRLRRNWSASDSVIHTFASLMLLSFVSLNYDAYRVLHLVNVNRANSTHQMEENVLYNRPQVHPFATKYMYYPIVVFVLLFFVGVLPSLLLLLYPVRLFRERLQRCCSQRFISGLKIFADTFQDPFKDGSHNGTRDFRFFPGLFSCLILIVFIMSCFVTGVRAYFLSTTTVFYTLLSVVTACVRPCKSSVANTSLAFHFLLIACEAACLNFWIQNLNMDTTVLVYLFVITSSSPHILIFIWFFYKVECKLHLLQRSLACINSVFGHTICKKELFINETTSLLPDRLVNSKEYRN